MKICNSCNKELDDLMFSHSRNQCKKCRESQRLARNRTKEGLVKSIFSCQICNSKKRGDVAPSYSLDELKEWIYSQNKFHELYIAWQNSGYKKSHVPSVDRIDDYIGYTLNNIQLMTYKENVDKAHKDIREGRNNKQSKAVRKITKSGVFVEEFFSVAEAARILGKNPANIRACIKGSIPSAYGFIWKAV